MVTCTWLDYQILLLLFQENQRMNKEISEVKAQLSVKSGDLLRLEELLDRVQEDKKRLSNRCNKMMSNGILHLNYIGFILHCTLACHGFMVRYF